MYDWLYISGSVTIDLLGIQDKNAQIDVKYMKYNLNKL